MVKTNIRDVKIEENIDYDAKITRRQDKNNLYITIDNKDYRINESRLNRSMWDSIELNENFKIRIHRTDKTRLGKLSVHGVLIPTKILANQHSNIEHEAVDNTKLVEMVKKMDKDKTLLIEDDLFLMIDYIELNSLKPETKQRAFKRLKDIIKELLSRKTETIEILI